MPTGSPAHRLATSVITVAGRGAADRGRRYAARGMVARLEWDPQDHVLTGRVRGSRGMSYSATASIDFDGSVPLYNGGRCSCPVTLNCKHTVAMTVQATEFLLEQAREPAPPRWYEVLSSVLGRDRLAPTTPLAIRFSTTAPGGYGPGGYGRSGYGRGDDLFIRMMRPGKKPGTWINGSMNWNDVALMGPEYARDQVDALAEIHRLHRAMVPYAVGADKDLRLNIVNSPAVWDALARARRAGVQFIHAAPKSGPVPEPIDGDVVVDVTDTPQGGRSIVPAVRVGGLSVPLRRFSPIGGPAHGLFVLTDPGADLATPQGDGTPPGTPGAGSIIRMVRVPGRIPDALWDLAGTDAAVTIPEEDVARFNAEFAPRLGELAPVISTDDSFSVPAVLPPVLELHARFGGGAGGGNANGNSTDAADTHSVDLDWMWRYTVGTDDHRFPANQSALTPVRDLPAEQRILESVMTDVPFERFGMRSTPGDPIAASTTLFGMDTLRAATELLPLLQSRDDVAVVIEGSAPDYREVGDSLQIGIAADDDGDPQTDWFDLTVRVSVEGGEVPLASLISALAREDSHLILDDGRFLSLDKPELQQLRSLLDEARSLQDRPSEGLKISRFQAGLWEELAALGVVERQAAAWQRQVQGLLDIQDSDAPLPRTLDAELRPYQTDGYRWLEFLWRNGLGGILADDMGLGKTVQSLALLCRARECAPDAPPAVILAPSSVVPNWALEARRFAPELAVRVLGQTSRKSGLPLAEACAGADVIITSYTLFRLDYELYDELDWQMLLMDEAQFVKNHQSRAYQCARRLQAPVKIGITGTPMENNLMELWSLLSITAPGLFPSPTAFTEHYRRPIERNGDDELLARLRRRIRPLMLRRTKEQVVRDLPAKQEQVLEVPLHAKHRHVYDARLKREQQKVLGLLDDVDKNRFEIFRSLTMLRQLSLDVALVDPESTVPSAKIEALLEHLTELTAGGHKALVFSQFTGFLTRIRERLSAAGIACSYLDGSTRDRARVIEDFTSGTTDVFLISLKAGGFGLNLTEADYCFILDPWWNPATEQQAVDRAHRIGQTRTVMVYRMISEGTIEDKVMALKERKAQLVAGVLEEGGGMSAALDADDIRALLT